MATCGSDLSIAASEVVSLDTTIAAFATPSRAYEEAVMEPAAIYSWPPWRARLR